MASAAEQQLSNSASYPVHPSTGYGFMAGKAHVVLSYKPQCSSCASPNEVDIRFTHNHNSADNKYNNILFGNGMYLLQASAMPTKNPVMDSLVGKQYPDQVLDLVYSTNTPADHVAKLLKTEVEPLRWVDVSKGSPVTHQRDPLQEYNSHLGDAFFETIEHAGKAILSCSVRHDVTVHSFGIDEDGKIAADSWVKMAKFVDLLFNIAQQFNSHMFSEYTAFVRSGDKKTSETVIPAAHMYGETFDPSNLANEIKEYRRRKMRTMLGPTKTDVAMQILKDLETNHSEILDAMLEDVSNLTMRFYLSMLYSQRYLHDFPCFVEYFLFPPETIKGKIMTPMNHVPCLVQMAGDCRLLGTKRQAEFNKAPMLVIAEQDERTKQLKRRNAQNSHITFKVGSFIDTDRQVGDPIKYNVKTRKGFTLTFFANCITHADSKNQGMRASVPRIMLIPRQSAEEQQEHEMMDGYGPEDSAAPPLPTPPPIEDHSASKRPVEQDTAHESDGDEVFRDMEIEV